MIRVERDNSLSDFCCSMSLEEAEARKLVAEQEEFKGKIGFIEDKLATQELKLVNAVVGVTSMVDSGDTALLRLFGSRVAAVVDFDRSLGLLGEIPNRKEMLTTYLEQVVQQDEGKPIKRIRAWGE